MREDRICNKCDAEVLGNEYHVLFQCNNEEIVRLHSQDITVLYHHTTNVCYLYAQQQCKGS